MTRAAGPTEDATCRQFVVPALLRAGWAEDQIVEQRYSRTAGSSQQAGGTGAVPVELDETYRAAGIYSFGRGLFARPPITGAETKYKTLFRMHDRQFIYSRLFAWEGALAVVPFSFDGYYVSQEFPTFDVNPERAEPDYLAWLCRWKPLWESRQVGTKGLGLRRQRVQAEDLLATKVPLPPIEEQRRLRGIARAVDQLDVVNRSFDTTFKALEPSIIGAAMDGRL